MRERQGALVRRGSQRNSPQLRTQSGRPCGNTLASRRRDTVMASRERSHRSSCRTGDLLTSPSPASQWHATVWMVAGCSPASGRTRSKSLPQCTQRRQRGPGLTMTLSILSLTRVSTAGRPGDVTAAINAASVPSLSPIATWPTPGRSRTHTVQGAEQCAILTGSRPGRMIDGSITGHAAGVR